MTLSQTNSACGCDERSGDGAGILCSIPDSFFRRSCKQQLGITLPSAGRYALGLLFLPKAFQERKQAKEHIQRIVAEHGQSFLCWRPVPTNNQCLGATSRASEPWMEHLIIEAADGLLEDEFNSTCYVISKHITQGWQSPARLYICSLSPPIVVYKGQLTPGQVREYFIDLS